MCVWLAGTCTHPSMSSRTDEDGSAHTTDTYWEISPSRVSELLVRTHTTCT